MDSLNTGEYGESEKVGPEIRYKRAGETEVSDGGIKLETYKVEVLGGTALEFDPESAQGKLGCKGVYVAELDGGKEVRKYFLWGDNQVTVENQRLVKADGARVLMNDLPEALAGTTPPILRVGYRIESAPSITGEGPKDHALLFTEIRPKEFTLPPAPKILA